MSYVAELKQILFFESIVSQIIVSSFLGIFLIFSHGYFFRYLFNKNTIFLSLMLPATILVVVTVIKTNIFLALGMVGALSIVRYRTPVKSQYELAILFALISIGIIVGVNSVYGILLTLFLSSIPLIYFISINYFPILKKIDYDSMSEERISVSMITKYDNSDDAFNKPIKGFLVRKDSDIENKEISFLFSFEDINSALEFEKNVKKRKTLKSISISKWLLH